MAESSDSNQPDFAAKIEEMGARLHDLNNTLSGVFGSTSIIKNVLATQGSISNEKLIKNVDRIDQAAQRTLETIELIRNIKNDLLAP